MKKILIMGLPGSGKTTLAKLLVAKLQSAGHSVAWLNADYIRTEYNDWDFSTAGRIRQATRLHQLAEQLHNVDFVVCDFIAALQEQRNIFNADQVYWLNTIDASRYEDTNAAFEPPSFNCHGMVISTIDSEYWSTYICNQLTSC